MTPERQADLLALAKRAQAGERQAVEEVRVRVAKVLHPGQVKMLWVYVEPECGCRTICFGCEFNDESAHNHIQAFIWPCAPVMVEQRAGGESPILKPCPDWPTDIAAAFELGEEARKRGRLGEFSVAIHSMHREPTGLIGWKLAQAGPIERCVAFLIACDEEGGGQG